MSVRSRSNAFVAFCLEKGYTGTISKDLRRARRQRIKSENWKLDSVPENHVNDRRRYYREEYLKSDHWKQLRSLKLRLSPKCQHCGSEKRLDVHHLRYRNLFDVTVDDLKTLCRRCHKLEHLQPT